MTSIAYTGAPRVNLMPKSEIARRDRDKLLRTWVWIVFASILIAVLIIAGTLWLKLMSDQRLAEEQARTNSLLIEIASLSEVSQALDTRSELSSFRADAMATDITWSPVIAKIQSALPGEASLTGFDLATGAVPQGTDPAIEAGLVGTVTIDSPTPLDIVAVIRSLRGLEGVMHADGQSISSSQVNEGRFAYLLNVIFDQSAYSGAYATADEAGTN
jgi:hypothetical protein